MYYYIYKIVCTNKDHLLFNHYYYGKRQSELPPELDNYKGSGKLILEYLNEHPYDYTKEIICICNDISELNNKEREIIADHLDNELCLNCFRGGFGGDTYTSMPEHLKIERRKNISNALKGSKKRERSIEHREKLSISLKGKNKSEEHKKKISESKKGKHLSEQHKLNISKGLKGIRKHKYTELERLKMSLIMQDRMTNPEIRKQISDSVKKSMQSEEVRQKCREGGYHTIGLLWISNTIETKRVPKDQLQYYFNLGYHRGRKKY